MDALASASSDVVHQTHLLNCSQPIVLVSLECQIASEGDIRDDGLAEHDPMMID